MLSPLHEQLDFLDDSGRVVAVLNLYAQDGFLRRISRPEAHSFGEEPIQLLENGRCEYEFLPPSIRLSEETGLGIVATSSNPARAHCGQIFPGLRTGRLPLLAYDVDGKVVGRAAIEVFSAKVSYRAEYRQMMEEITEHCVSLLMELRSPSAQKFVPDPGRTAQTIHQRFAFLKSLIASRPFRDALHRITTHPHRRWEPEERVNDISRRFRPDGNSLRKLAKGFSRVPLPDKHPLKAKVDSLPARITVCRNVQTEDTPENRFIKFALRSFSGFLNKMRLKLEYLGSETDTRLRTEIEALEGDLEAALSADIFRGVYEPDMLPLGSPVLQCKEGYREILQAWLKFDMAARLVWHGGEDVYGAGQRDISTLYEYWVFFKLLDVVSGIFDLKKPPVKSLIRKTKDGFGLQLRAGKYLPIRGAFDAGSRRLDVKFSYNRTFSHQEGHAVRGSWTRNMRPDYTLSLWPAEFSEKEAESQELMIHVHFDAKYRVDFIEQLFGDEQDTNGGESSQGSYKREDLLKMHAYRDAIRRTQGAYVIYPGTELKHWQGYHEILPGLGAFPLKPGGSAAGIEQFLCDVVTHVCDRATARERQSYHLYQAHEVEPLYGVRQTLPECEPEVKRRHSPPAETSVLVGWCKSEEHLEWITRSGLYNCRMGSGRGSLELSSEMASAKYLLLHFEGGKTVPGLMRITSKGPKVFSKSDLVRKGYPGTPSQDYYLVYSVDKEPALERVAWDYSRIEERLKARLSGFPHPISLDAVLAAAEYDV